MYVLFNVCPDISHQASRELQLAKSRVVHAALVLDDISDDELPHAPAATAATAGGEDGGGGCLSETSSLADDDDGDNDGHSHSQGVEVSLIASTMNCCDVGTGNTHNTNGTDLS